MCSLDKHFSRDGCSDALTTLARVRVKDALFRVGTGVHQAILGISRGRLLGRLGGMPVVVLTTTGRRSGKKRSTVLTSPLTDRNRIVLVGSYGGDHRHPQWFLNLRENPDVGVTIEGQQRRMHARVASQEERTELWPRIVDSYGRYGAYQQRSARQIPLVILEPTG